MRLKQLFRDLAQVFDGPELIEAKAKAALSAADCSGVSLTDPLPLRPPFVEAMTRADAHPINRLILELPFRWTPPQTSNDPLYRAHSHFKAHVELLGPEGLVKSDEVRLGLYGLLPEAEYGLRTHPAEEVFVMLAGNALWKRGTADYAPAGPGERSHHPSMLQHATKTQTSAFMSVYVWSGDLSTDGYVYQGLPEG